VHAYTSIPSQCARLTRLACIVREGRPKPAASIKPAELILQKIEISPSNKQLKSTKKKWAPSHEVAAWHLPTQLFQGASGAATRRRHRGLTWALTKQPQPTARSPHFSFLRGQTGLSTLLPTSGMISRDGLTLGPLPRPRGSLFLSFPCIFTAIEIG
jgi:hypothetical protein